VVQAVRGQSFVAPDAATLAGFAASVLVAAGGIALTIRKARRNAALEASAEPADAALREPAASR
jgi:hypothetical protein